MYNILTPTETLMRELFDIQKMLSKAGASQESRNVIERIGITAFDNVTKNHDNPPNETIFHET